MRAGYPPMPTGHNKATMALVNGLADPEEEDPDEDWFQDEEEG